MRRSWNFGMQKRLENARDRNVGWQRAREKERKKHKRNEIHESAGLVHCAKGV